MDRHPDDPDELPATHAWRVIVQSHLDDPESTWTRSSLAKKAGTSPSQMLKLLNGTTKSSVYVRRINEILDIPFVEPLPVGREYADAVKMIMEVDDLEWLMRTIEMVAGKPKNSAK